MYCSPMIHLLLLVLSIVGGSRLEEIFVSQGKRLELPCEQFIRSKNSSFLWKINGNNVPPSSRRYLRDSNLVIERVDRFQDDGEYVCELRNADPNDYARNDAIFVRVNWIGDNASVSLVSPKDLTRVQHGSDITLRCIAYGSNQLRIDWFRNGERISNSDKISIETDSLHIKRANSHDNGIYRCRASNDAGSVDSGMNFSLKIKSEKCPNLNDISRDAIVEEGSSATLYCLYDKYDVLEWYFNESGPVKNDSRFALSPDSSSLYVRSAQKNVEGMYACVGVKKECDTFPSKYTIMLSVADLDKTNSSLLEPDDQMSHVVPLGGNFTIACVPPRGKPAPVVTWKNQFNEKIGNGSSVRTNGRRLIITNAEREMSGMYTCRAENLAGFAESSFGLTVAVAPRITDHPSSQIAPEGNDVSFYCKYEATASPFSEIVWRKNNVDFEKNTSGKPAPANEGGARLDLSSVEAGDAAEYSCVVNTKFYPPVMSRSATLTVMEKLKFNPLPVAKKMELGLANKIPCKAEGSEPPAIQWIKANFDGRSVPFPSHVHDLNGTLYFSKVRNEDKGRYTCVASNRQGSINVTIDVDVVVAPKFTILPKNPSEGYEKSSVRLDCVAEGDPVPTMQWNNNFVDISQKRFTTFSNGSLLINELHLSDAGTYGCIAGNSGGFNKTEVVLLVRSLDGNTNDGSLDSIEGDTVGRTVIITLGAACAYILLVVVLMAWCRYRRRKKKRTYSDLNVDSVPMDDAEETKLQSNTSELKETSKNTQNGGSQNVKRNSSFSKYLSENCVGLEFSRKNLHDIMLLGNGELGNVFLARNKCDEDAVVMVKVLEDVTPEFRRQLDILKQVDHDHVVKLIGVCREAEPIYMILEYTDWGDLKQFLIATRKSSVRVVGNKQRPPPLTTKQALKIAAEAASALEHLAQLRCTHRDVATRNCLITSSLNIKFTFSSLCKNTYATEYYEIRDQLLPLRWLPFEAVAEGEFSTKTDAYSYSCFLWEIFTKGELPFSKLSNEEVLSLLEKRQLRWKIPKSMPPALANLLNKCWSIDSAERPSFSQISKEISEIVNLVEPT